MRLLTEMQILVEAGWFRDLDDLMLDALRWFVESHRAELMERQGFQTTGQRFVLGAENVERRRGMRFGWRTRAGRHWAGPLEVDLWTLCISTAR